MRRGRIFAVVVGVALLALAGWAAGHTSWEDVRVPMPPRGEARVNPFYAAQRFAEVLGARTAWDRVFMTPPTDAVVVLSAWHWTLSARRQRAFEHWVESGGRLVLDSSLTGGQDVFERWSGIRRELVKRGARQRGDRDDNDDGCGEYQEGQGAPDSVNEESVRHRICNVQKPFSLRSSRPVEWALFDESGMQAVRVRVGRGHVTVINASPFRFRNLFDADHGWLFVSAAQLRRGDEVHFVSEEAYPSLLALAWRHGAPVVLLSLAIAGLCLWRGCVRFAPLIAPAERARRSLAEQIRGTGQFAASHGDEASLHAAVVRALDESAERRVPRYALLSGGERASALAQLTGCDPAALWTAFNHPHLRRRHEIAGSITLLERARRQLLAAQKRSAYATR